MSKRFPTHSKIGPVLFCLVLAVASATAFAQAGQLDKTFASNGIFTDNFGGATGFATLVAVQSDGKIVAVGASGTNNETQARGVVVRLNANGTLDTSFGTGGVVSIKFGDIGAFANGLAIQTDGKILVSGTSGLGGGDLVRLNTNGSFDTAFGNAGFASGLDLSAAGLALQGDGKIVVIGQANLSGVGVAEMQRFGSNGQLDTTFGKGGSAPLVFAGSTITVLSSGKLLVTSGGFFGFGGGAAVR